MFFGHFFTADFSSLSGMGAAPLRLPQSASLSPPQIKNKLNSPTNMTDM